MNFKYSVIYNIAREWNVVRPLKFKSMCVVGCSFVIRLHTLGHGCSFAVMQDNPSMSCSSRVVVRNRIIHCCVALDMFSLLCNICAVVTILVW